MSKRSNMLAHPSSLFAPGGEVAGEHAKAKGTQFPHRCVRDSHTVAGTYRRNIPSGLGSVALRHRGHLNFPTLPRHRKLEHGGPFVGSVIQKFQIPGCGEDKIGITIFVVEVSLFVYGPRSTHDGNPCRTSGPRYGAARVAELAGSINTGFRCFSEQYTLREVASGHQGHLNFPARIELRHRSSEARA